MITYYFKVEFFESSSDIYTETDKIYEVQTSNNGIHLQGSTSTQWVADSSVAYFNTNIRIYNLDFDFSQKLKWGNRVVLSYKTNFNSNWRLMVSGILATPEDSDSDNGDYVLDLNIFQVSRNAYLRNTLNQNFQGMTVISALQSVLQDKLGEVSISSETQNMVIEGSFFCNTIEEFLNRIQSYGGFSIKTSYGSSINTFSDSSLFVVQERSELITGFDTINAKNLEFYGLHYIPQVELETNNELNIVYRYWEAQIFLTKSVEVGDSVFFRDRLNNIVQGIVQTISYSFATRGPCTGTLRIIDIKSSYAGNNDPNVNPNT